MWVMMGSAIQAMQSERVFTLLCHKCVVSSCRVERRNVVTEAPHSWKPTAMQTVGHSLQFLQLCWSPNGDTDCYYRHFRDSFYATVLGKLLGKKVSSSPQHLKCCGGSIFPIDWGDTNATSVSATSAGKALLLWGWLVPANLLIWRGRRMVIR